MPKLKKPELKLSLSGKSQPTAPCLLTLGSGLDCIPSDLVLLATVRDRYADWP